MPAKEHTGKSHDKLWKEWRERQKSYSLFIRGLCFCPMMSGISMVSWNLPVPFPSPFPLCLLLASCLAPRINGIYWVICYDLWGSAGVLLDTERKASGVTVTSVTITSLNQQQITQWKTELRRQRVTKFGQHSLHPIRPEYDFFYSQAFQLHELFVTCNRKALTPSVTLFFMPVQLSCEWPE